MIKSYNLIITKFLYNIFFLMKIAKYIFKIIEQVFNNSEKSDKA